MVSFTRSIAVAAIATISSAWALQEGEYYRPTTSEASGVYGTTAPYRRAPCPALNTLANHGYLPRNGQNITHDMLSSALQKVYNIGPGVAALLVAALPDPINLDYLGIHNKIEHDASLAHTDAYYVHDPMTANVTLAEEFFSRAGSDGLLTNSIVAKTRKDRGNTCNAQNPECSYGVQAQSLAFLEASVLLMALGSGDSISVDHARSFIVDEKIPADYKAPKSSVGVAAVTARAALLKAQSLTWAM
ncbi:chloroperoxidase [Phytophthora sojae]|uniref:Chloroperoxidase n=1 Tax=Phytophthora sojae (strain P6497) TaxID=1094619 RepID=G4Z525_PHYSP|nr:chloroperoxidase [Phytophthora sojae]EGZ19471.1 chloroperoxidase [Phytophthora sojae]|eukprot:XP_009522188.1 chloroperoxidase [Phytophthora sojae]